MNFCWSKLADKKNLASRHSELLYWISNRQFQSEMDLPLEKVSKITCDALTISFPPLLTQKWYSYANGLVSSEKNICGGASLVRVVFATIRTGVDFIEIGLKFVDNWKPHIGRKAILRYKFSNNRDLFFKLRYWIPLYLQLNLRTFSLVHRKQWNRYLADSVIPWVDQHRIVRIKM